MQGQDNRQDIRQLTETAKKGDPEAMFNLGVMYAKGDGVEKDPAKACQWYEKAAEAGHAGAMFNLGVMYAKGDGVEKDPAKARQWWQKAAEAGHAGAMFNLGLMYAKGDGVEKAPAKARQWWEKAAEKGHVGAMFILGFIYEKGEGVEKDPLKARQWYEKAAEAGDVQTMVYVALMYALGQGGDRDPQNARRWFKQAAKKGDMTAMFLLGMMYATGEGGQQDFGEARKWLEKAAEQGNPKAMFRLGVMYCRGEGVAKNLRTARRWFENGAQKGHVTASLFQRVLDAWQDTEAGETLFEQIDTLIQCVDHWRHKQVYKHSKALVSHYTSVEALRSILREGRLRLYNVTYFNDPSEGVSLVEYSRCLAASKGAENEDYCLHEFFREDEAEDLPIVYVASFCSSDAGNKGRTEEVETGEGGVTDARPAEPEDRDSRESRAEDLALWHAYGHRGEGICIRMPARVFDDTTGDLVVAKAYVVLSSVSGSECSGRSSEEEQPTGEPAYEKTVPRLTLYRVVYEDKEKNALLKALNDPLSAIKQILDQSNTAESAGKAVRQVVCSILADVLHLCKDSHYAFEKEVRLLSAHLPTAPEVKMDDKSRLYVETRCFLFREEGYEIIVGPKTDNATATRLEITWRARQEGIDGNLEVKASTVPFR